MKRRMLLAMAAVVALSIRAQIVERQRPAEWSNLVYGARFMDRILPMRTGHKEFNLWGTDSVRNRYVDNGIESKDVSFWGGNILQTKDGKYHLYVCGWPENSPKGHMFWKNSTVFHATSNSLDGPYKVENTIGKGHNPEAFRLNDGRIAVYVIDGYYIGASEDSKIWYYQQFQFDARGRRIIEGLSNLTFARRQDGSYLMVCRGGGVWISRDGLTPYRQITSSRVYPAIDGRFEDPVVWRDSLQYHLIVNDWLGRIAYYQRSRDGLHWVTEQGEAYVPGISVHENGEVEQWFKYERPKVFQDKYGRVEQINFAVIDTVKWNDLPNDNHSSKNICLPTNKGMRLMVINDKPITKKTKTVVVRIQAEEGFRPQQDVDVKSLRFGDYTEVNFGRGARAMSVRQDGADLIVTFKASDCKLSDGEFAPKMLGRTNSGKLLYGYARLPYVNYQPALLSAGAPTYHKDRNELSVCVENFGLSTSKPAQVEVYQSDKLIAQGTAAALKPYASCPLQLSPITHPATDAAFEVVIKQDGKEVERTLFNAK